MKRGAISAAVVLFLVLCACTGESEKTEQASLHVGLVFDVGGLGDKSFNDSAYEGLKRAGEELGVSFSFFEPGEGSDREAALRLMAAGETDLIFGVGFLFTDDIAAVAREFPAKHFACIDYAIKDTLPLPQNLAAIKFREEEGSFLAGALAGLLTETGSLGFVGGMEGALIKKFESGYRAGVLHVRPDAQVLVNYAGVTDVAFKDPSKGKELALAQYDAGADIIYHASGATGLGVFEAARERDRLAIGVDSDQWREAPNHVLTSVLKRVDVAVYEVIRRTLGESFPSGVQVLGLKEGAVGIVVDENNRKWVTPQIEAQVRELEQEIVRGRIMVPSS
jgi:basic membrane protein A